MPSIEPILSSSSISIDDINNNCLFFFYFFIGCYIICVTFLIYTLIRLLKYYIRQRQMNSITNELIYYPSTITTAVLLKIHNINEEDSKSEIDLLQPFILPPIYSDKNQNQSPPDYKEHL